MLTSTASPLIMFDGPNGVGKSTQIELTAAALRATGYQLYLSRINGGTPIGEALRKVSRDATLDRPVKTDLHIMLATAYALAEDLRQHRAAGELCLVDRSPLSIIAYQVYGGGLPKAEGGAAVQDILQALQPTLLICYLAPLSTLKARRRQVAGRPDFFESQPDSYAERLITGYRDAAQSYGAKIIQAIDSSAAVHQATMQLIKPYLPTSI